VLSFLWVGQQTKEGRETAFGPAPLKPSGPKIPRGAAKRARAKLVVG